MHLRRTAIFMTLLPLGLAPIAALAEGCGDYPLTDKQIEYIEEQELDITIPVGEVPVIIRCDVDGNNVIDSADLAIIRKHRGQPAAHPDDPMDWDGNGVINGRDVGGCASSCTTIDCEVTQLEEAGLEAAQVEGDEALEGDPAACFQVEDIDGDGVEDFVGINEHAGSTRVDDWNLELDFFIEDPAGNVQHIRAPYTGKVIDGKLLHHVSLQPPGFVDLNPGSIYTEHPAFVSYRENVPQVIYYYDSDGNFAQAAFGVDD